MTAQIVPLAAVPPGWRVRYVSKVGWQATHAAHPVKVHGATLELVLGTLAELEGHLSTEPVSQPTTQS